VISLERRTAAQAWVAAFAATRDEGDVVNLITTWTDESEHSGLEKLLDDYMAPRGGWTVLTVANTIFADELYDRALGDEALTQFCEWYLDGLAVSRRASPGGEYCERIVAWEGRDGEIVNQLLFVAERLKSYVDPAKPKYNYSSVYEIGIEHPSLDLRTHMPGQNLGLYAFPCLSHISLTAKGEKLHLTALYRNQHLLAKAYGNYLGLTRLCSALCHHTGLQFGSVTVVATHADSQVGSPGYPKGELGDWFDEASAIVG
jgi:thymidylate synthase